MLGVMIHTGHLWGIKIPRFSFCSFRMTYSTISFVEHVEMMASSNSLWLYKCFDLWKYVKFFLLKHEDKALSNMSQQAWIQGLQVRHSQTPLKCTCHFAPWLLVFSPLKWEYGILSMGIRAWSKQTEPGCIFALLDSRCNALKAVCFLSQLA